MPNDKQTLPENIEALFEPRVNNTGDHVSIKLGDGRVTVTYEEFTRLRDSIASVVVWYSKGKLVEEFSDLKMPHKLTIVGSIIRAFTAGFPEGAGFSQIDMENSDWQAFLVCKGSGYEKEVDALIAATDED